MNKEELRAHAAQTLGVPEKSLIWSPDCANPTTQYHNEERETVAFESHGYWVIHIK